MREASGGERTAPVEPAPTVEALTAALEAERARTREADHRAKNTLQLVSSLLFLLSRRSGDEETRRTMKAMHQRVGALAAVHRNLLACERPDRFDLTQLVRDQAASLAQTDGAGASVRLDLDPVEVDTAAACPLALIVNELVLNALTHGRAEGRAPEVAVSLRRTGEGYSLTVQDDGPGPAAVEANGFGLTIVRLLADQLAARFELEDGRPGLRAVVRAG